MQRNVGLGPNALKWFKYFGKILNPFLCGGALRHRNTREYYSNNLKAFGPKPTFSCTRQFEDETEEKGRQENKTQ